MYDRILVPTDGSTGSAHVAMQAFDLADRYGATVHVLHVVDGSLRSVLGSDSATEALREPGRRAVETLEQLARSDDLETVTALREGDPAEEILDCAGDVDADLIVMGTHGRSGIERRLIGSVAETVVRHAERPVMTVRLPETGETVEDEGEAADIVAETLAEEGRDAEIDAVERQRHVWVVDATADGSALTVYLDPVTRRTSTVSRADD